MELDANFIPMCKDYDYQANQVLMNAPSGRKSLRVLVGQSPHIPDTCGA